MRIKYRFLISLLYRKSMVLAFFWCISFVNRWRWRVSVVGWSMEAQIAIPCPDRNCRIIWISNGNQREHGNAAVRRWFRGNRLPHHQPCDISSKQNYSNRLHSRDVIVLGLIELLWLSEDRYKILTISRTSTFNASEYVDHKIQIWLGFSHMGGST